MLAGIPLSIRAPAPMGGDPCAPALWPRSYPVVGPTHWDSWRDLVVAVVGCGRTGSAVAGSLVAQDIRRLVLIDDDLLGESNLDGMPMARHRDVGLPKVDALSGALRRLRGARLRVETVRAPLESPRSVAALAGADVVVSSVDCDPPRILAAALSRRLLQLHLDIGTASDALRGVCGADVRLGCPWGPCLLCAGGVANMANDAIGTTGNRPAGTSSRSINSVAAEVGVRMLVNLVHWGGSTRWLRLRLDADASVTTSSPDPGQPAPACALCGTATRA